jgi:hypothetical protein
MRLNGPSLASPITGNERRRLGSCSRLSYSVLMPSLTETPEEKKHAETRLSPEHGLMLRQHQTPAHERQGQPKGASLGG